MSVRPDNKAFLNYRGEPDDVPAALMTDEEVASVTSLVALGGNFVATSTPATENVLLRPASTSVVTGGGNTAFGYKAFRVAVGAIDCTAFGHEAMHNLVSGVGGCAFGRLSLATLTVANGNTGFGDSTLRATTSGESNTAVGYTAGDGNTTGSFNTWIGTAAQRASTTGSYNTAVGYAALFESAGAAKDGNTAVGYHAGYKYQSVEICAVGYRALTNDIGLRNTAFGAYAGANLTAVSAQYNIHIGYGAGSAPPQRVDAINTIAIGKDVSTTKDYQCILGNDLITETLLRGRVILGGLQTPASATAAGVAGTVCADANYLYVCTATDTWKRVAVATW